MAARTTGSSLAGLLGRRSECLALDHLLAGTRSGRSAALVLRGEAGIGKSALLDYLVEQSTGCRVVRTAGVQSEMELSYAGLHQLCGPLLDQLGELPAPQRDALATAFGLEDGETPSRFLVSLAVLSLLADAAADQPLVCVVDDAQWLDHASAQTLAFIARRLQAESILFVFGLRDPSPGGEILGGLPELRIDGLTEGYARALLSSVVIGRLDDRVRDRIVAETRGNPLALLELPRGLTAAELAGGFARPDARPLSGQIEQGFVDRIRTLPAGTQRLLCAAAAEPTGDVTLLLRAAERLDVASDTTLTTDVSGLLTFDSRVRFRHPLARSAAYRVADLETRRAVHRALAEATDEQLDPDRRVWHLARAASATDEAVAAELERSADRARARGGVAAAAAFLGGAVELTPDPTRRGSRALAAAQAKYQAGAFDAALELAATAELSPLDELDSALLSLLRGQILDTTRSSSSGVPLLLDAAGRLEALDVARARATYRDALHAAINAQGFAGPDVLAISRAVLSGPRPGRRSREQLLLDGVATMITQGYAAGAPTVLRGLRGFEEGELSVQDGLGWLPLASRMAGELWDSRRWSSITGDLVDVARDTGALAALLLALLLRIPNRVAAGDIAAAESVAAEMAAVGEATGAGFLVPYAAVFIEPWKGNEAATHRAIVLLTEHLSTRGQTKTYGDTQWAAAVLFNGLGRFDEAQAAARRASENPDELGLASRALVELVEASARLRQPEEADDAVRRLSAMAAAADTDYAHGIALRCQALVSDDAGEYYQESIRRLGATEMQLDLARTRLCYGEWLRRAGRRTDARTQLAEAHEALSSFGAAGFAERARRELLATGTAVRPRAVATYQALTAQEAQIARLAGDGLTNPEIGARLFISRHTVDWHLRKVYAKLGITSRRELRAVLPDLALTSG
ncbi:helix-turn-helix transcriptional regulator [Kribbella shirazensis]|uniref:DNA-binding CsgD family transcriptional regulator n=1 Tax=Kribbella shirazensis TaxID=1105143 RepID=A0A7X5VJM7_9ACTN|nr:LuxR family transcriptional regulator [Kribbella shirazensis]NIK61313.1 DNA-binding CsgD family transcriptional regulator [Kribbella shirazensis]